MIFILALCFFQRDSKLVYTLRHPPRADVLFMPACILIVLQEWIS